MGVPKRGSRGQNGENRPKIKSCPKPPKVCASKLWAAKTGRKWSIFAILTLPTLLQPLTGVQLDRAISRDLALKWLKWMKFDQKTKVSPNHPEFVPANSGWYIGGLYRSNFGRIGLRNLSYPSQGYIKDGTHTPKSTKNRQYEPTLCTKSALKNDPDRSEGVPAPLFASRNPGDHFYGL